MNKDKEKKIRYFVVYVVAALVAVLFPLALYIDNNKIVKFDFDKYELANNDDYQVNFDVIDKEDDIYKLVGWVYKKNEDIYSNNTRLVIKSTKTNEQFLIPTMAVRRQDVTEFFSDGYNYDYCGFNAFVNNKHINAGEEYKIYILYGNNELDNEKSLIETDLIIKGE